jgi:hypothetical protein
LLLPLLMSLLFLFLLLLLPPHTDVVVVAATVDVAAVLVLAAPPSTHCSSSYLCFLFLVGVVDCAAVQPVGLQLPPPSQCTMPGTHSDMCIVRVRRYNLIEDALDEIARQFRKDLFKPLRVHFIGEEGIDAGGVKKEFFQLLIGELLSVDFGMLVYQPETHTYW